MLPTGNQTGSAKMLSLVLTGQIVLMRDQFRSNQIGAERSGWAMGVSILGIKNRISKARIRFPIPARFRKIQTVKYLIFETEQQQRKEKREREGGPEVEINISQLYCTVSFLSSHLSYVL